MSQLTIKISDELDKELRQERQGSALDSGHLHLVGVNIGASRASGVNI